MTLKIPPKFCPVLHALELDVDPAIDECKCLSYRGDKNGLMAKDGHSGFCMGKIKTHSLEASDVQHSNNYVLCISGPMTRTADGFGEGELRVLTSLINRNDMDLLHSMMHEAVGPKRSFQVEGRQRGFMEGDPDWEERDPEWEEGEEVTQNDE